MIVSRRQWLAGGAALAATIAGCAPVARGAAAASRPIGLQLYTVRELFSRDPHATLEQVAAIGYREVEYGGGGYDRMDHAALRATMDRLGLVSPSLHVGYEALASDFDGSVRMAKTLGADTIVLPWLVDQHRTADGWRAVLANLNPWAERLKAEGLGFAYHNHDFEFTVKHSGRSMFDALIAEADPELVKIELDLFWVVAAGEDPKAGVKHFYVENDQSPAPYLADITTSFAALSRLRA